MAAMTPAQRDLLMANHTPDEFDEIMAAAYEIYAASVDWQALRNLQDQETSLAISDAECSEGYDSAYRAKLAELEDPFVRQHETIIDRLRSLRPPIESTL